MVWTLNDSIIIIENFVYDGKGFGVFIHVGKFANHNFFIQLPFLYISRPFLWGRPKMTSLPWGVEYQGFRDDSIIFLGVKSVMKGTGI